MTLEAKIIESKALDLDEEDCFIILGPHRFRFVMPPYDDDGGGHYMTGHAIVELLSEKNEAFMDIIEERIKRNLNVAKELVDIIGEC